MRIISGKPFTMVTNWHFNNNVTRTNETLTLTFNSNMVVCKS